MFGSSTMSIFLPIRELSMGTQRPNVSRYTRSVSDGFSLCFRDLFGQFGVALKTIYLFGRLRGTLVVTKVLGGFFRLIRKWVRAKVIAPS